MNAPKPPSSPSAGPPASGPDAHEPIDESPLDELSSAEFEALRWSVRVSDGLGPEARAQFNAWLNADPAHRAAYDDIAGVWDAIDEIPPADNAHIRASVLIDTAARSSAQNAARAGPVPVPMPVPDLPEPPPKAADAPAQPAQAVAPPGSVPAPIPAPAPAPPVQATRRFTAQALAAVAAVGVLGGGWLGWKHWQSQPLFSQRYLTGRGYQRSVQLPDGSSLQLDTATEANVTFHRHRREVRVPEGQVFFEVQGDAARPFDVLAGAARITVVGTRFSVRYTPSLGGQAVQVAVSEGRVRVTSNSRAAEPAKAIVITTGQALTADTDGKLGAVTAVAAESVAPWRNHRLSFDGVPLAQVLAEIGRYGDTGLRVQDPAVGSLSVTASVDLRNLNAFVQILPRVLPVRLERRGNGVEIVSSKR